MTLRSLSFLCVMGVMSLSSLDAMAQQTNEEQTQQMGLLTMGTSVSAIPVLTSFVVATTAIELRESELRNNIKRLEGIVKVRLFLVRNQRQLDAAVALGAGATLCDLTQLVQPGVVCTSGLGKRIRRKRKALNAILRRPESFARAEAFYDAMSTLIDHSPYLLLGGQR